MDGSILMTSWSEVIAGKKIICSAENFYWAGIVNFTMHALLSEASSEFPNTPRYRRWTGANRRLRLYDYDGSILMKS